jgi:hypothetical protein
VLLLTGGLNAQPARISITLLPVASASTGVHRALEFLVQSGSSMTQPPGFEVEIQRRTPPLLIEGSITRTPPSSAPCAALTLLEPLFQEASRPLLLLPSSPPPHRVANRRKTLAGMSMVQSVTYSLRCASGKLKTKGKSKPVAEAFVCRELGIVQDGQEVTELVTNEFARRFEVQIPNGMLAALRELFQVGSPEDEAVDDALLLHGGAASLELSEDDAAAADDQA